MRKELFYVIEKTVLVTPVVSRYGNRRDLLGYERLFYGNLIFPLSAILCLAVGEVAQIALLLTQRKKAAAGTVAQQKYLLRL